MKEIIRTLLLIFVFAVSFDHCDDVCVVFRLGEIETSLVLLPSELNLKPWWEVFLFMVLFLLKMHLLVPWISDNLLTLCHIHELLAALCFNFGVCYYALCFGS